jgi:hypothetical protein
MVVVIAGIVIAIVRWKRHPKVSALTIAGLVIFQFQSLAFTSLYYFLPQLATRGWTWAAIDNLSIVVDVCHDVFFAVAIVLLAAAVFSGRSFQAAGPRTERVTPI